MDGREIENESKIKLHTFDLFRLTSFPALEFHHVEPIAHRPLCRFSLSLTQPNYSENVPQPHTPQEPFPKATASRC